MAKWYQKIFNWKGGSVKAQNSSYTVQRVNGGYQVVWGADNADRYIKDGYESNDIVYSIINMAAEKERQAPWDVYKIKDESSLKLYKSELAKFNGGRNSGDGFNLKKCLNYVLFHPLPFVLHYPSLLRASLSFLFRWRE